MRRRGRSAPTCSRSSTNLRAEDLFVSWRSDLATLRARTWVERSLLLEALLCLGLARAAILMFPFGRVVALCGLTQGETPKSLAPELVDRAARVGWAVRAASVR